MTRFVTRVFLGSVLLGAIAIPFAMAKDPVPAKGGDGVLDNATMKAGRVLGYTTEILNEEFAFAEINHYVKRGFSYTADPDMIAAIAKANDVVITAIGD